MRNLNQLIRMSFNGKNTDWVLSYLTYTMALSMTGYSDTTRVLTVTCLIQYADGKEMSTSILPGQIVEFDVGVKRVLVDVGDTSNS